MESKRNVFQNRTVMARHPGFGQTPNGTPAEGTGSAQAAEKLNLGTPHKANRIIATLPHVIDFEPLVRSCYFCDFQPKIALFCFFSWNRASFRSLFSPHRLICLPRLRAHPPSAGTSPHPLAPIAASRFRPVGMRPNRSRRQLSPS